MKENYCQEEYELPLPGVSAIGFFRVQNAYAPMQTERHPGTFELLYLQSGEKKLLASGREYLLHGGDMLVIHPDEPHGNRDCVQNRSSMQYLLLENPETAQDFLGLPLSLRQKLTARLLSLRLIRTNEETRRVLGRIAACAVAADQAEDDFSLPRLQALLVLLLDEILSGCTTPGEAIPPDIAKCLRYVADNPAEMFSVEQLAKAAGLSDARFKQKFKRCTGVPPAEYVAREHVRMAERLLRETDENATDIAMRLGFSSSQHFSRLFRRYNGLTPSDYRREQRANKP